MDKWLSVAMKLVVDYVSFVDNQQKTIVKEVGVAGQNVLQHFMFRPPVEWESLTDTTKKANEAKTKEEHGLRFCSGYIPYEELVSVLQNCLQRSTALYAFSRKKCDFLSALLGRTFICLEEEFRCPEPKRLILNGTVCLHPCHQVRSMYKCAQYDAHVLSQWLSYYDHFLRVNKLCSLMTSMENNSETNEASPVKKSSNVKCDDPGIC